MADTDTVARPHRLSSVAELSRIDRNSSRDALQALEDALSEPAPGREDRWLTTVIEALEVLDSALGTQSDRDSEASSLMSEIAADEPRLGPRVDRLRSEHADLRDSVKSLLGQIAPHPGMDIDIADIRDRLSSVARRLRQHRAREADLIYEAININLGVGD